MGDVFLFIVSSLLLMLSPHAPHDGSRLDAALPSMGAPLPAQGLQLLVVVGALAGTSRCRLLTLCSTHPLRADVVVEHWKVVTALPDWLLLSSLLSTGCR